MNSHMTEIVRISRFGFVNAFLVPENDGLTVVDTMLWGGAKPILAAAQRLGAPIVRIALTHGHGDHIGSLDDLHAALPDAEVIISARDARLLDKDTSLDPGEPQVKVRGMISGASTKPTRTVSGGDILGSLEVISTPGHTPGHVAFLDRRDGTLLCGDAYTTIGGVATTTGRNLRFPLAISGTWHGPTELESARALRALEPERLAPGHGKVVESPVTAMDAAIAKAS
jgi:glyoxylase-like metal-dependent hydrolase (beta-lactamase superfamily II)